MGYLVDISQAQKATTSPLWRDAVPPRPGSQTGCLDFVSYRMCVSVNFSSDLQSRSDRRTVIRLKLIVTFSDTFCYAIY